MRDWLEMPISACVGEVASIPRKMCGFGIESMKHLAQKMCLQKRYSLRTSVSADVREIWADTATQHVPIDALIVSHSSATDATKTLKLNQSQKDVNHLFGLQLQGVLAKGVTESIASKNITLWASTLDNIPAHLFNFARKAFLQVLPTAANLKRWNRTQDPNCPLCACGQPQTNKHVLSNCGCPTALHRYTARHNSILALIVAWLRSSVSTGQLLYADLSESNVLLVCDLFQNFRPDIAIANNNSIQILELTVCHETNLISSRNYKVNKYKNINDFGSTLAANRKIMPYFVEVSTLGFISDTSDFTNAANIPKMPEALKHSIVADVLKSSYSIYCNRNNAAFDSNV